MNEPKYLQCVAGLEKAIGCSPLPMPREMSRWKGGQFPAKRCLVSRLVCSTTGADHSLPHATPGSLSHRVELEGLEAGD